MKTEFEQKVFAIVEHAHELPPHERTQFINESCGGDEDLRKEVLATLNADTGKLSDHGNSSTHDPKEVLNSENQPLPKVSGYEVVKLIGRGGVGSVYQAQSLSLNMPVAIKVLDQTFLSEQIKTRFEQERQILAKLDLPGIARIIDVGTTEQGRPFFCMELIEGIRIDHYCANHHLSLKQRLQLFLGVIELVREAHKNLILHCDLKPDNILVDEKGQARLLDFGIAKILQSQDNTDKTVTGQRMLTPRYASPEQVSDKPLNMVSDVYSLGVLLFRLLTGGNPYSLDEPKQEQLFTLIQSDQRLKASTTLHSRQKEQAGTSNQDPNQELTPSYAPKLLEGDIDRILARAIHPDEKQRYQSVEALADDLQRYLTGHPVLARGDSFSYRATKFIGRNKVGVLSAAVVVFILLGATIYSRIQQIRAEEAQKEAELTSDFLVDLFEFGRPQEQLGKDLPVSKILERGQKEAEALDPSPLKAKMLFTLGKVQTELGEYKAAKTLLIESNRIFQDFNEDRNADASLLQLANAEVYLGETQEARKKYEIVAKKNKNTFKDDRFTEAVIGLTSLDILEGQPQKGVDRILKLIPQIEQKKPLLQHYIQALVLLGSIHSNLSSYQESIQFFQKALALQIESLPENHPDTLGTQNKLGLVYFESGQFEKAFEILESNLEARKKVHGETHPSTLVSANNLTLLYFQKGQLEKAKEYGRWIVEQRKKMLGDTHPDTANAISNLSVYHSQSGELEEAIQLALEASKIRESILNPQDPMLAQTYQVVGSVYRRLGDFPQAEQYLIRSYNILKSQEKPIKLLGTVCNTLGVLYGNQNKPTEAIKFHEEGLDVQLQVLSPDHIEIGISYVSIGAIYAKLGLHSLAENSILEGLAILQAKLPPEHHYILIAKRSLGRILADVGCEGRAEKLLLEALEGFEKTFGAAHKDTQETVEYLEGLYLGFFG